MSGDDVNIQGKRRWQEVVPEPQLLDPVQKRQLFDLLTTTKPSAGMDKSEGRLSGSRGSCLPAEEEQSPGVIQPLSSPLASPVVMVKKKDGSHPFCVN